MERLCRLLERSQERYSGAAPTLYCMLHIFWYSSVKKNNSFELQTKDRVYYFYADTEKQRQDWITALHRLVLFRYACVAVGVQFFTCGMGEVCLISALLFPLRAANLSRQIRASSPAILQCNKRICLTCSSLIYSLLFVSLPFYFTSSIASWDTYFTCMHMQPHPQQQK